MIFFTINQRRSATSSVARWKLDLETKAWTWAAGDNTYDYPGSMALPGARAGAATYTQVCIIGSLV